MQKAILAVIFIATLFIGCAPDDDSQHAENASIPTEEGTEVVTVANKIAPPLPNVNVPNHDFMVEPSQDKKVTFENGTELFIPAGTLVDEDGNIVEAPIKNDMQVIHEFTGDLKTIDATQRLKYDQNKVVVFNFGKYQGKPVAETLYKDRQYYNWILNKEFSSQVKQIVKRLVKEYSKTQRNG